MKILFEKKIWFEATAKLMRLYKNLSDTDFQFKEGGEYRMMERIRTKIQLSKLEFYQMVGFSVANESLATTSASSTNTVTARL